MCYLFSEVIINNTQTLPSQINLRLQKNIICHLSTDIKITTNQTPSSENDTQHSQYSYTYIYSELRQNSSQNSTPVKINTITRLTHFNQTMWGQSNISMAACLYLIITVRIKSPGNTTFLVWHRLTTLEAST